MKVKTEDLEGMPLDWAVAFCRLLRILDGKVIAARDHATMASRREGFARPSKDWKEGGPIIEFDGIHLEQVFGGPEGSFASPVGWRAWIHSRGGVISPQRLEGPTALVAAMRAFVAHRLGKEVHVPDELFDPQEDLGDNDSATVRTRMR